MENRRETLSHAGQKKESAKKTTNKANAQSKAKAQSSKNITAKNANTNKQSAAEKTPLNSLADILADIFTVELTKGGKHKPIKVGSQHKTALKSLERAELPDNKLMDKLTANIATVDLTYKHLLELIVFSSCARAQVRQALINFAVLAVSHNWKGRHCGSDNIFIELASPVDLTNKDVIAVICRNVKGFFANQLENRKKDVAKQPDEPNSSEQASGIEDNIKVSNSDLKKKAANLVAIACLWGLETGKCSADKAINQMQQLILADDKPQVNLDIEVCYSYASSIKTPIDEFNIAIRYFEQTLEVSEDRRKHAEKERQAKGVELTRNKNKLVELNATVDAKDAEIKALEAELASLKEESRERQLTEQASRVHLRDDAGKAKSKAYNLLAEEVEPAMQLSLKALMRENPKVEVAIHQIELALESIEENLPWFK